MGQFCGAYMQMNGMKIGKIIEEQLLDKEHSLYAQSSKTQGDIQNEEMFKFNQENALLKNQNDYVYTIKMK